MLKQLTAEQQQLVIENHNFIYFFLRKNNLTDDWYDIAAIGLCKAARAFDKEKEIKFASFAYVCMRNEFFMEYRKHKRQNKNIVASLDDITFENLTYADVIPDSYCFETDLDSIISFEQASLNLTKREK